MEGNLASTSTVIQLFTWRTHTLKQAGACALATDAMMEIPGLALATLSALENLVHAFNHVAAFVRNVKHVGEDQENIIVRITTEKAITLQLKALLFTEGKDYPCLFLQLDEGAQVGMSAILRAFEQTIERYIPLQERYNFKETAKDSNDGSAKDCGRKSLNTTFENMTKTARWAAGDKKRVAALVDEFEVWNKKIKQLIEIEILDRQIRVDGHRPKLQISSTREAKQLGIEDALAAQAKALMPLPPHGGGQVGEDFEQSWMELRDTKEQESGKFEIGSYRGHSVVVDSKLYSGYKPEAEKKEVVPKAHLNQLVSVLQHLQSFESSVPECLCWVNRSDQGLLSLLFKLPSDLYPKPQSLLHALPDRSFSFGPPLEERLHVAYGLASVVDRLHSVSWIHKNIRSENILFFYTKASIAAPASNEPEVSQALPPKWFLYGFEYARRIDWATSRKLDTDRNRNIYRHPERWGIPTADFRPIHDIYALGVVLLELGMWRKATSLVGKDEPRPPNPIQVRSRLIERAARHLGFTAGTAFRDVVLRCLKSDFDVKLGDSYEAHKRLGSKFRSLVVDELRALAFPHLEASQQIRGTAWTLEEDMEDSETSSD